MTTRVYIFTMLAAMSILPAVPLEAVGATRKPAWRVKYMAGPITIQGKDEEKDLPEGSRLRVAIAKDRIMVSRKNQPVLTVSAAEVSDVSYYRISSSRSKQVFGDVSVWDSIGGCEEAALYCAALVLPIYAATAPFAYRDHYVRIAWRSEGPESGEDEGFDQDVEFKVGKRDWSKFLTELTKATGKRWKDESPKIWQVNKRPK